ncbi:MAG: hypothetical protein H7236_13850 [Gemmatimonadaceae bacterium]|nr:hypothetical protein [Caulobacter sp.]
MTLATDEVVSRGHAQDSDLDGEMRMMQQSTALPSLSDLLRQMDSNESQPDSFKAIDFSVYYDGDFRCRGEFLTPEGRDAFEDIAVAYIGASPAQAEMFLRYYGNELSEDGATIINSGSKLSHLDGLYTIAHPSSRDDDTYQFSMVLENKLYRFVQAYCRDHAIKSKTGEPDTLSYKNCFIKFIELCKQKLINDKLGEN